VTSYCNGRVKYIGNVLPLWFATKRFKSFHLYSTESTWVCHKISLDFPRCVVQWFESLTFTIFVRWKNGTNLAWHLVTVWTSHQSLLAKCGKSILPLKTSRITNALAIYLRFSIVSKPSRAYLESLGKGPAVNTQRRKKKPWKLKIRLLESILDQLSAFFYLPHMEYEGIGFMMRKMKFFYCWFSHFRTFYG
jgi:hypothetical protein